MQKALCRKGEVDKDEHNMLAILEEVEGANCEVDSTNMPGTSKDHLESNEEYFQSKKKYLNSRVLKQF